MRIRRDVAEDAEAKMMQDPAPIPQAPAARDKFPQGADFKPEDKAKDDAHPVFPDYASI